MLVCFIYGAKLYQEFGINVKSGLKCSFFGPATAAILLLYVVSVPCRMQKLWFLVPCSACLAVSLQRNCLFDKKMESDSLIIIPTYNEKENIENIIRAVLGLEHGFHVLVIDDGSPDGTADIVKRLMDDEFAGSLHLVERSGKLGLGTAYIAGFKWALERDYEYVFEMDADFSHDPKDVPRLYEAVASGKGDVAVGSRYVSGVNVVNWPMGRVLMSYFASKYVKLITGLPVHDTTAGFVCYRRKVLETIDLDAICFKGYAFQIEMKFTAYKLGYKVEEVPVIFVNRQLGNSKMSGGIFSEALFGVMKLRWRAMTGGIKPRK